MAVELLPTTEKPSVVGALMLHLQHIEQGQTTGTNQLQFHCAVSLFFLVQSLITALVATPVSSKLLRLSITQKPRTSTN